MNATAWFGSDFHSCAADNPFYTAPACNATFSFTGREVTLVGDFNPSQQRFYVILDDALPWRWYNASALAPNIPVRTPALNYNRVQIRGLPYGAHKITFGQDRSDVMANGITLDSVNYNTNTSEESPVWTSDFIPAKPNPAYMYSTQTVANPTPSATSSSITSATSSTTSSAAPSATSQPSHSSSNTVALGAGLGAGLGVAAILALTALLFFVRRRRSSGTSVDSKSYVSNGLDVHGAARSDWGGTQHVPSPSTYGALNPLLEPFRRAALTSPV